MNPTSKREPGAPPDPPCPWCGGPLKLSTRSGHLFATCTGSPGRAWCGFEGPAPIAGSASFSALLDTYRAAMHPAAEVAARERLIALMECREAAQRAVDEIAEWLATLPGGRTGDPLAKQVKSRFARVESLHRDEVAELEGALAGSREALEVCVESENAMRKERDEARTERDRLAAAFQRLARQARANLKTMAVEVGRVADARRAAWTWTAEYAESVLRTGVGDGP